ncbi:MAG: GDSL-like Lipase/Acylhydrolase [Nocardioides sp.]|nr:GDSL-like Lipase/Acylhydrolase [Nocardioides sp.]
MLLALAVPTGPVGAPASADDGGQPAAATPLRVLVVGDSVTQGAAGDWTWRYRLWRHLSRGERPVDLVGPRDDLFDHLAGAHGSPDYLDGAFDRDHAARWGMSFEYADQDVGDLVTAHQPDVVVELLGFNDLVPLASPPAEVLERARSFVASARRADPTVDVVLGEVAQSWATGAAAYNAGLRGLADELDSAASPVVVATTSAGLQERAHTWDRVHLNARGELVVAASVADALHGLGLAAPYPRPLPVVPVGPRRASSLSLTAGDATATLRWTGAAGVDSHQWLWRDRTAGQPWRRLDDLGPSGTRRLTGLVNGHTYATRLRPVRGWQAGADDVLALATVRPLPPRPGAPGRPTLRTPRPDRVVVAAAPAARADTYAVQVAAARSCRSEALTYRTARRGLARPVATLVVRQPVVRVRLVARNLAGAGPAGPSACVQVR